MERRDGVVVVQSKTDGTKAGTELDSNKRAYFLKRECQSNLNGKPPVKRPLEMNPARKFLSPLRSSRGCGRNDRPKALMAFNLVVENERSLDRYREVSMFMSTDSDKEVSILSGSGANIHIIPLKEDPRNIRTVTRSCVFEKKEQLQVRALVEMPLHLNIRGKEALIRVTLKDVR